MGDALQALRAESTKYVPHSHAVMQLCRGIIIMLVNGFYLFLYPFSSIIMNNLCIYIYICVYEYSFIHMQAHTLFEPSHQFSHLSSHPPLTGSYVTVYVHNVQSLIGLIKGDGDRAQTDQGAPQVRGAGAGVVAVMHLGQGRL